MHIRKPVFIQRCWLGIGGLLWALPAAADYRLNFQEPVSPLTESMYHLHMLTTTIATVIMVIIIGIMSYTLYRFRKSKGYQPDQHFHTGWFGRWGWMGVPIIVLGIDLNIAGSAQKTLMDIEDYKTVADITVKITGSQWKWTYEYIDGPGKGIKFTSNKLPKETAGNHYLLAVDNPLVLPTHKRVRFLQTSTDVLHAWWVPAVAGKKDAIPGFINETWTNIQKEGTFRGQCAENCGTGHAFMPIEVKAVSEKDYLAWVDAKQQEIAAAAAEAAATRDWSKEDLMAKGEKVYLTNCVACHQATGLGVPGVFPALKDSKIAKGGAIADHLNIVIKGKTGTAMAAWGGQLNDLEIAAVITYERNAWDNNTGDLVQPSAVKAAR